MAEIKNPAWPHMPGPPQVCGRSGGSAGGAAGCGGSGRAHKEGARDVGVARRAGGRGGVAPRRGVPSVLLHDRAPQRRCLPRVRAPPGSLSLSLPLSLSRSLSLSLSLSLARSLARSLSLSLSLSIGAVLAPGGSRRGGGRGTGPEREGRSGFGELRPPRGGGTSLCVGDGREGSAKGRSGAER